MACQAVTCGQSRPWKTHRTPLRRPPAKVRRGHRLAPNSTVGGSVFARKRAKSGAPALAGPNPPLAAHARRPKRAGRHRRSGPGVRDRRRRPVARRCHGSAPVSRLRRPPSPVAARGALARPRLEAGDGGLHAGPASTPLGLQQGVAGKDARAGCRSDRGRPSRLPASTPSVLNSVSSTSGFLSLFNGIRWCLLGLPCTQKKALI